jgi:ribosomal protein L19
MIDEIEKVRSSKVRRAKLYFVRRKAAKEIRRQMRKVMSQKDEVVSTDETKTEEVK